MLKKQLLIILFIFWAQESSCFMTDLFDIVKKVWKFAQYLYNTKPVKIATKALKDYINKDDNSTENVEDLKEIINRDDNFTKIVEELEVINHKLDDLKVYSVNKLNYITLLIEQLPAELAIQSKKNELAEFVAITHKLWNDLTSYVQHGATDEMFNDLANEIKDNLRLKLVVFRNALTPSSGSVDSAHNGLFMLIAENAEIKRDILCDQGETSHHKILSLFQIAMATEIEAHILLFVAHFIKYSDNNAWKMPLEKDFKEQFNRSVEIFENALKISKLPYIRSCEPDDWRLDDNCYGLNGYLQQTIYRSGDNIGENPENLQPAPVYEKRHVDPEWDSVYPLNKHAECDGIPFDCRLLQPDYGGTFTCAWEDGPYRIRFIKYGGKFFGTDKEAIKLLREGNERNCSDINFIESEWWYREKFYSLDCKCSASRTRILRQTIGSMSHENYVIVGLRMNKVHDCLYIQIAEGKLEANGYITNYSWVLPTRAKYHSGSKSLVIDRVQIYDSAFFMGDVQLPPGYALTSIGFVQREMNRVAGTAIKIGGCKFNYGTGEVDPSQKFESLVEHGTDHALDFPTKTPINKTTGGHTSTKTENYTHTYLQQSDLEDDYGQTTLPLLDGLPVMTKPLSPIGGVGFFYKAFAGDYAGLLSLRLYPLDYTYFMDIFKRTNDVNSMLNSTN